MIVISIWQMRELKYRFVTTDYKQKNVPLEKKKKMCLWLWREFRNRSPTRFKSFCWPLVEISLWKASPVYHFGTAPNLNFSLHEAGVYTWIKCSESAFDDGILWWERERLRDNSCQGHSANTSFIFQRSSGPRSSQYCNLFFSVFRWEDQRPQS